MVNSIGKFDLDLSCATKALVKAGAPDDFCIDMDGKLLVYNEKRNFQCTIDPRKLEAQELLSVIRDRGVGGVKAYFWAFMEVGKPNELIVVTDPIHPAQSW